MYRRTITSSTSKFLNNMKSIAQQTYNDEVKTYMKRSKKELVKMVIECTQTLAMYLKERRKQEIKIKKI